jgi:hypothetical protein
VYAVAERPDVRIHVRDLGLACCAVEFAAAIGRGLLVPAAADPGTAAGLVVSGTVTDPLAGTRAASLATSVTVIEVTVVSSPSPTAIRSS